MAARQSPFLAAVVLPTIKRLLKLNFNLTSGSKLSSIYLSIFTTMSTDPFDAALDLLRRLPPSKTSQYIAALTQIAPQLTEELLESVDVPLDVKHCNKTGRDFLCCDYNRDGDSYRSPWSNEFEPPLEDGDGVVPSERIRKMEIRANEAVDVYRDLYVL